MAHKCSSQRVGGRLNDSSTSISPLSQLPNMKALNYQKFNPLTEASIGSEWMANMSEGYNSYKI